MKQQPTSQLHIPRLEADGETHRRDCECARCELGFRPSETDRRDAALRWEELRVREAAAAALERKRERAREKAARLQLALDRDWQRTRAYLAEQARLAGRVGHDDRLDALLDLRRRGARTAEALAEVDRRFGPKPADTTAGSRPPLKHAG